MSSSRLWSFLRSAVCVSLLLSLSCVSIFAEQAVLTPAKDNTIYEHPEGALSNGKGDAIFVGINGENGGCRVMRALLAFRVSSIPAGSTVESVTLTMRQSNPQDRWAASREISLHRLMQDWGEGNSLATGGGGGGAAGAPADCPNTAAPPVQESADATWLDAFCGSPYSVGWPEGGNFDGNASASIPVLGNGSYTWGSTGEMVKDVQEWVNDASSNFGWLVKGEENGSGVTAKRFVSRESNFQNQKPTLTVVFTPAPDMVFPHVFNLDSNNNSYIYVQNLSDGESNDVTVKYVGQDGLEAGTETKELAEYGSARFMDLPESFQGVAQVFCSRDCTAAGTWNFRLMGQQSFAVSIPPIGPKPSMNWAVPIPLIGPNSGLGIAVHTVTIEAASCSAVYYASGGERAAVDDFPAGPGIPAGGQTALLSPNVPGKVPPTLIGPEGFEGSLLLKCSDFVIPLVVIQDQVNGFPTPITLDPQ